MPETLSRKAALGILGCFLLYLLASFSSWHEPVMGDEVILLMGSKAVIDPAIGRFFIGQGDAAFGAWHPPAYVLIMAGLGRMFGFNAFTPRLLSIICFLGALIMVFLIAKRLSGSGEQGLRCGLWACLVYALTPLAVRGSLLVDMDGTILNLTVLVFIYALCRPRRQSLEGAGMWMSAVLLALVFCVKLSAPLLLAAAMIGYGICRKDTVTVWRLLRVWTVAAVLFAGLWLAWAFFQQRDPLDVLRVPLSVLQAFAGRSRSAEGLSLYARNLWALVTWTTVSFMLLAGMAVRHVFTSADDANRLFSRRQLAVYALLVALAYLLVGGVTHSFPKYHIAAIAPLAALIGLFLGETLVLQRRDMRFLAVCAFACFLYHVYVIADPFYGVNYLLKQDMILAAGKSSRIIFREALRFAAMLLAPVLVFAVVRLRGLGWKHALVVTLLSAQLGLSFVQSRAAYHTVYCYGAEGVEKTARFIRERTDSTRPIIAPQEIRWLASDTLASYGLFRDVRTAEDLLRLIEEKDIACVCYGITGNSLAQYRTFFQHPLVSGYLGRRFSRRDIGSYTVWLRN